MSKPAIELLPVRARVKYYLLLIGWYTFTAFAWAYCGFVGVLFPFMREQALDTLNSLQRNQDDLFKMFELSVDEVGDWIREKEEELDE